MNGDDPAQTGSTGGGDPRWARVKRIFERARQLPREERPAFLEKECGDDASLRAEVEELLDDLEAAGPFLNEPAVSLRAEPTFQNGELLLGRFRILEFIGHGGMGQVYRAEDMYSGGELAVKAIRPEIAADPEVSRRFRRELRMARQVTHPNVCRVFELWASKTESGGDVVFLTMELMQGETIAQRLAKRAKLTPAEALSIAKQVAAGIAEVHRLGIVHRDVKPSNVFLVREQDGRERAVVMDFGLARTVQPGVTQQMTRAGAMLGTPAYMAPELFQGADASVASDVYGFGVTLYEMVTGRSHPVITPRKLAPGLKPWAAEIVKCLDPDTGKRPLDVRRVVERIESAPRRTRWKRAIVAALVLAIAGAGVFTLNRGIRPPATLARLTFDEGFTGDFSFTADGRTLVYSSDRAGPGNLNIWIQDLASSQAHKLAPSLWHDLEPAISPDGRLVAFRSERDGSGIYEVPTAGGIPRLVAKYGHHPRFSADGRWLAYWTGQTGDYSEASARLWVVPSGGGEPRRIAANFADARYPAWAPEGHLILFRGAPTGFPRVDQDGDWYVANIDTGRIVRTFAFRQLRPLHLDPHDAPVFWDRDRVVFSARSQFATNIWQMRFGLMAFRLDRDPERLTTGSSLEVAPWVLPGGRVAYASWNAAVRIWRVSTSDGKLEQITEDDSLNSRPTVSADGKLLLFGRRLAAVRSTYLLDLSSRASPRLVEKESRPSAAISPDGRLAAFTENTEKGPRILVKDLASGSETTLCDDCGEVLSWLPDSSAILYLRRSPDHGREIRMLDRASRQSSAVLSGGAFDQAAVSPDGRLIAFNIRKDGVTATIYVAPFVRGREVAIGGRFALSDGTTWDDKPQWSPNGSEIFYSSNRDGFMCLWRRKVDPRGSPVGEPKFLLHMHKATFSPMQLSNVPSYNLSASSGMVYFNSTTINGNLWLLEP
jgi:Tol biopolymer transport system component